MFIRHLCVCKWVWGRALSVAAVALLLNGCAGLGFGASEPQVDNSMTTHQLASLPPPHGPRKKVAIYRFSSSVPEIGSRGATDMFTTALVKSHRFEVLERQRLSEGALREKSMNASGMTTGHSARRKLIGADYIFHGTVSGINIGASGSHAGGSVEGLHLEGGGGKSVLTVDVRVVDARTGAVLDAIDVHQAVKRGGVGVSGIGSFFHRVTHVDTYGTDAHFSTHRKEGIDRALRNCIEEAVYRLAKRFGN